MYAVIEESPGVGNEDRGRTIWMWDDKQTSESIGGAQEKKSSITVRRYSLSFGWPLIQLNIIGPP